MVEKESTDKLEVQWRVVVYIHINLYNLEVNCKYSSVY
jgi:hypothetical protein